MNRRDALKLVAVLTGGAISSSVVSGVLSGCTHGSAATGYRLQTLTADQDELVATVVDLIIPPTDTPGARDVGVDRFVDAMITTGYKPEERDRFMAGLADLDARSRASHSVAFVDATPARQTAILTDLQAEAKQTAEAGGEGQPFFHMLKELTLVGYYTSEAGATQELKTVIVPGHYDGDVPYDELGRAWA